MRRIFVIGATGMLGEPVARGLKDNGFLVRVFTRDLIKAKSRLGESFEFVSGDVEVLPSLEQAMQDCSGVHISLRGGHTAEMLDRIEHLGTANIARAAAKSSIERITLLSYAANLEHYTNVPYARAKYLGETAVMKSGIPYTIFRATHFMESLKFYFQKQQAYIIGDQPHRFHWCAADDYSQMVSKAYNNPETRNKRLYVLGPEALTMREALETYCRTKKPGTKISSMPFWMPRLMGILTFNPEMKFASSLMRFFSEVGEQGDSSEANQLLGAPQTTLEEWSAKSNIN